MLFEKRKRRKMQHLDSSRPPPTLSISPPPAYATHSDSVPQQPQYSEAVVPTHNRPPVAYQQAHNESSLDALCINTPYPVAGAMAGYYDKSPSLYDACADKLYDVISLIDDDEFRGEESDLLLMLPASQTQLQAQPIHEGARSLMFYGKHTHQPRKPKDKPVEVFSKLDFYLNSHLPVSLPPLQVYMPTWPLICLAAEYSANAYLSPQSSVEKKNFVSADGRMGTKAMVIKSVPCDDKNTIVFAIRGTGVLSLKDWGVNLKTNPKSPAGFLDDEGNLCHDGFLRVAKAMVRPIATRLRNLLQENPSRASCSLLITGHSAGGAVASLLYAHMLSSTVQSELNVLTGCFKRVHCITFGAPPVTLLPLQKPNASDLRLRKCLFHSFMNEGDPVVRAEPAYIKSLIDLLASSTGKPVAQKKSSTALNALGASMSRLDLNVKASKSRMNLRHHNHSAKLWWEVPPAILSNAGRLVVLRAPKGMPERETVTANIVTDEQLRQVIFGDPIMHQMAIYRSRLEALAFRAVTGKLRV